jgi:hypothetical protein
VSKQKPEQTQENLRKLLEQHWEHCRHLEVERSHFMLSYAVVVGSVIVGFSGFIIRGGVADVANNVTISVNNVTILVNNMAGLANNTTGVEYLEQLGILLPSFFDFIFAFLIGFTVFGFFHTVRWTYAHECHRQRVKKLTSWMNPDSTSAILWEDLDMDIPSMELPLPNLPGIWKSLQKLRKSRQARRKLWHQLKPRQACSKLWQRLKEFREAFRTRYWFPALYFFMLILFAIVFPSPFQWWAIGCLVFALWLGIGFFCSKPK